MVEVVLNTSPIRPGWYVASDVYYINAEIISPTRKSLRAHVWRPPTDVYEVEDAVFVRVEIAGMRQNEFSISIDGHTLIIRGNRSNTFSRRIYHQMEISYGEFGCEVEIPADVDIDQAQAEYRDGFLNIILPKPITE